MLPYALRGQAPHAGNRGQLPEREGSRAHDPGLRGPDAAAYLPYGHRNGHGLGIQGFHTLGEHAPPFQTAAVQGGKAVPPAMIQQLNAALNKIKKEG